MAVIQQPNLDEKGAMAEWLNTLYGYVGDDVAIEVGRKRTSNPKIFTGNFLGLTTKKINPDSTRTYFLIRTEKGKTLVKIGKVRSLSY